MHPCSKRSRNVVCAVGTFSRTYGELSNGCNRLVFSVTEHVFTKSRSHQYQHIRVFNLLNSTTNFPVEHNYFFTNDKLLVYVFTQLPHPLVTCCNKFREIVYFRDIFFFGKLLISPNDLFSSKSLPVITSVKKKHFI